MTDQPQIPAPEGSEPQDTRFADAAAARLGIRKEGDSIVFDAKSLLTSFGGWVGIIEAVIPYNAFLVIYAIWHNTLWAVAVAGGLSLISIIKQLIQRKPVTQAIAGAALTALSAWLALGTHGGAKEYFLPGIITNLVYGAVLLLSILIRFPIIGIFVGFFKGWGLGWRKDKHLLNRFDLITGIWVALFALRLGVELPLYFTNNVTGLGIAKLVLGYPPYAIVLWFTWLGIKNVISTKP